MLTDLPVGRTPLACVCLLTTLLLALLLSADARAAEKRSLAALVAGGKAVTFDLRPLPSAAIRGAHLRVRGGNRRVRVGAVRRAARRNKRLTLRLRRPVGAAKRKNARLLVIYRERARRTLRKTATTARSVKAPVKSKTLKPVEPAPTEPEPEPEPAPVTEQAPAAEPAPATHTCDFGSFQVGAWPSGCWRPYADSSPFNRTIPAGAPSHPNSDAIVQRVLGFGLLRHLTAGEADTADDWSHPTYYSTPEDPYFTLHCYENWGKCAIEGMQIRIPDAARPAAGGDGHLTVVDQASGWEYDLYKVRSKPAGGGTLEFRWGGRTRIDGDGLGSDATASRFGNLAGMIRAQEMEAAQIAHALFMNARCDSGTYVYPAMKNGRSCSSIGESNVDAPPMGARFQFAMSPAEIEALNVPRWKKTILLAMSRYGMYLGDTGGSWGVFFESSSTYTSFGAEDALVKFARENNVPQYNGRYVFNLREGIDWERYLRVVDPCTAQGTCA